MGMQPEIAKAMELLREMGITGDPQDPAVRTRTRLLQAATRLFQARGYRYTSVDEIAREAGVAKGTIYIYFKNKQELLLHAIAEEKKRFLTKFIPLLAAELPPAERLVRYLELSIIAIQDAPLVSKLMAGDKEILMQLDELGEDLREQIQQAQFDTAMAMAMARGVGAFDSLSLRERRQRARVLLDVLAAELPNKRCRGEMGLETYARHLAKLIVSGVGAP